MPSNLGPPLHWVAPVNDFALLVNPVVLWELMTSLPGEVVAA